MAVGVSKAVINAAVIKRRALIQAGKFRLRLPSPPNPFKLLRNRRMNKQESEFYNFLKAFEGRGKGKGLLP